MKSKRAIDTIIAAERFINDESVEKRLDIDSAIVERIFAEQAVELAEEDARERAIEAFKRYITKNSISSILLSDKILMDVAMNEFKEKYDNE